jgi:hypothetical protein
MIQTDDSIRVKIAGLQVDAKEFVRVFECNRMRTSALTR